MKNRKYIFVLIIISILFAGWGSVGHRIINGHSVYSFPQEMNILLYWNDGLAQHASDADDRKGEDPDEAPKHFIDIDSYDIFVNTGRIPQTFDSLVAMYGYGEVIDNGIVPFTILITEDSLTNQLQRKDWNKALLTAADLGHYVGDAHMPLHITKNYNGQNTGQSGVHSRYESNMVGRYQQQLNVTGDSAVYVEDLNDYVFSFIYKNYKYVDSVLAADSYAKSIAGNTSSDLYYQKLWEKTGEFTKLLFKKASTTLASLIYTAWCNAGKPSTVTGINGFISSVTDFKLEQNYPNPFNPSTRIRFSIPPVVQGTVPVTIKIYDMLGNEAGVLLNEEKSAGSYEVEINTHLASGVYIYKMTAGNVFTSSRKMIVLK